MSDLACEIQLNSKTKDTNHSNATNKETNKQIHRYSMSLTNQQTNKHNHQTGKQTSSASVDVRPCLRDTTDFKHQRYQSFKRNKQRKKQKTSSLFYVLDLGKQTNTTTKHAIKHIWRLFLPGLACRMQLNPT